MVAPTDGLSLADRIAKRQADEKKLAAELAGEEKKRLIAYDKPKLALHTQVFAAIKKVRDAYTKAKSKEDVEKIRAAQQKTIDATGKKMMTIDPKGGNSNVVTDYDVMLDALSNSYPDALAESFGGDKKPLEEVSARARQADEEGRELARRREGGQEVAMATVDELQKEHEARLATLLAELAGRGAESNLALVRALIHKGVHLAAEQKAIEFCALATFLGGDDRARPSAPARRRQEHRRAPRRRPLAAPVHRGEARSGLGFARRANRREQRQRLALAAHVHRRHRLPVVARADALVRRRRHQHRRARLLRQPFDARGDVDGVADRRVVEPARGRADVADDGDAGVQADADAQRRLAALGALAVQAGQLVEHRHRAVERVQRVIGVGERRAEVRHDPVADELVERAAVLEDLARPCVRSIR